MQFGTLGKLRGLEPFTPVGITVHYLGSVNVMSAAEYLDTANLAYHIIIDKGGNAWQMADFKKRVNHAGVATWQGYSPNRTHLAIALASWGQLKFERKKLKTWAGQTFKAEDAAYRAGNLGLAKTWWDAATHEQVEKLLEILRHFVLGGIHPANICGHDECALPSGRKQDPGGVLPFSMAELRNILMRDILKV